jgi:hypothetical protein
VNEIRTSQYKPGEMNYENMSPFLLALLTPPSAVQEIQGVDSEGNPRTVYQYSFTPETLFDEMHKNAREDPNILYVSIGDMQRLRLAPYLAPLMNAPRRRRKCAQRRLHVRVDRSRKHLKRRLASEKRRSDGRN